MKLCNPPCGDPSTANAFVLPITWLGMLETLPFVGDILKMVEDCTGEALKKHPPVSFHHIFWQQQPQYAH